MTFTKRSDFPETLPTDKTQYCWHCHSPGAEKQGTNPVSYYCAACGQNAERVLIHDPHMQAHFDAQERLVHESCGVFLFRRDGKVLLFKRTKFPFLLTIPAGHLEDNEDPLSCARRETQEEVGIAVDALAHLYEGNIIGDSCLGGADIHHWNAYGAVVADNVAVKLDSEGESWQWYDLTQLTPDNTVQPVLFLLAQPDLQKALRVHLHI
jgi:8-oxo-dGTP pyrophosphatase MutT (NUDIX family)